MPFVFSNSNIIIMKNLFAACLLSAVMFLSHPIFAQSCCTPGQWPLLAMNDDFKEAHLVPEPFNYTPAKGSMIQFETVDAGKPGNAFYIPSDEPTNHILFIFHEWWGLNDYIKQEAEKWQKDLGNVDVYAIDLYDGKIATDQKTASEYSSKLDNKRAENIIKGALKKAGNDKLVATLGWCMGGTWSFTATLLAGNNAAGCVMYYGFPEKSEKKIKTLQADVLYVWASQDNFITKNDVGEFQKAVEATGKKFTWHTFDAAHAFANPSNPKHDKLAAAQADAYALKFLKEKFQLD